MLKLVYYAGDTVVREEEVPVEDVDSAVTEVCAQDYDQLGLDLEKDEFGCHIDCMIGLMLDNEGYLIWQNSDGDRGYDFDVNEMDVDDRIKAALNAVYD